MLMVYYITILCKIILYNEFNNQEEHTMGIIEKMRLDGKKGFVTGAARGIGKCTAT